VFSSAVNLVSLFFHSLFFKATRFHCFAFDKNLAALVLKKKFQTILNILNSNLSVASEKAKEIMNKHFNDRTLFNIKSLIQRGHENALVQAVEKFNEELKASNERVEYKELEKRFEDLGSLKLLHDNAEKIKKIMNAQPVDTSGLYSDLTERAKSIFFKHLNDDNLERFSSQAEEDPMIFKKVFINLIRELKEKNEKIKGAHIVNRMLEYGVNPEYWNDQLNSIKTMIEELEGKKQEPFHDEELEQLAKELSEALPQDVSTEKIKESEETQKLENQYNRFIKMQLNLSTQLMRLEDNVLKRALEQKEEKSEASENIEARKLNEIKESFHTFLQELATIDEVDHDNVSIVTVKSDFEGRQVTIPAVRVPFKIDFQTLKKYLSEVYNSKTTPYFSTETPEQFSVRNTFFEKELTADKTGLTFNLDIEPGKRLLRHAERLKELKKLIRA